MNKARKGFRGDIDSFYEWLDNLKKTYLTVKLVRQVNVGNIRDIYDCEAIVTFEGEDPEEDLQFICRVPWRVLGISEKQTPEEALQMLRNLEFKTVADYIYEHTDNLN